MHPIPHVVEYTATPPERTTTLTHALDPTIPSSSDLDQEALLTGYLGEVFLVSATRVDDCMYMSMDSASLVGRTVDFTLEQAEAWHIRWGNILTAARRQYNEHLARLAREEGAEHAAQVRSECMATRALLRSEPEAGTAELV